jgi:SOS response regulatory protein OraA/RecX
MSHLHIVSDEKDPRWCELHWEGLFWKRIYKTFFIRKLNPLLRAGSLEELEKAFIILEEKIAKDQSIRWLSKRALFSLDLKKKLEEKGFSSFATQQALAYCQKIGALKDEELIDAKIRKELRSGKGLYYIQKKWKNSLQEEDREVEWYSLERQKLEKEAIIQFLQKKGKVWNVLDRKEKSALVVFLLRRGFRKETIKDVLFEDVY